MTTWADAPTCHNVDTVFRMPETAVTWKPPVDEIDTHGYPNIFPWRRCSYCGSIHPGDLVELAKTVTFTDAFEAYETSRDKPHMEVADLKYGFPHKIYVTPQIIIRPEDDFQHGTKTEKGMSVPIMGKGVRPWIKFYTVHLGDAGIDDEAFAAIAKLMHDHAGVIFEKDEKGVKWKGRPR